MNDDPTQSSLELVLGNARAYDPTRELNADTLISEMPYFQEEGSWQTLLLFSGLDVSTLELAKQPETIRDVALIIDQHMAAETEEAIPDQPVPPAARNVLLSQLQTIELNRTRPIQIAGAVHFEERGSRASNFYKSNANDLAVVYSCVAGQHASKLLEQIIAQSLEDPTTTDVRERAEWPLNLAQAAAMEAISPRFVAVASMTSLSIRGSKVVVASVGQTRVLRIRGDGGAWVTKDQVMESQYGKFLTGYIGGTRPSFAIDFYEFDHQPNDRYLLASTDIVRAQPVEYLVQTVSEFGFRAPKTIVQVTAAAAENGVASAVLVG